MPFDLLAFGIPEMLRCGREVREVARSGATMEDAAQGIVRYFYDAFCGADAGRQCILVRFYKLHPFGLLEPDLQRFARGLLRAGESDGGADAAAAPSDALRCLTLLGTVGDEPAWCDRRRSRGHQAIPLVSAEAVEQAPMIAALFRELGVDVHAVVRGSLVATAEGGQVERKTYNVFHVEQAAGSPHIPAQDEFVLPNRVRSVVGFGGQLRSGAPFAVILFTRVPVSAGTAERFRNIALDVKYALFKMGDEQVFASHAG